MSEKSTVVQTAPELASLKVVEPMALSERIDRIRQNIARRAFEIFKIDGGFFGHELDHWFKAETELLHPVHVKVTESDDAITVQAEVPGFSANELEVSIESNRLTISGKKEVSKEDRQKGKTIYREQCLT